jgi:hypothetical protein
MKFDQFYLFPLALENFSPTKSLESWNIAALWGAVGEQAGNSRCLVG